MSEIIFNPPKSEDTAVAALKSQIENLQTTLASLNQQVFFLQEALQERDQKIAGLQTRLTDADLMVTASRITSGEAKIENHPDHTLTIAGVLINLFKFVFPPGKDHAGSTGAA